VHDYNERFAMAESRLESWLKENWPNWDPEVEDMPETFVGVDYCPQCNCEFLVMEQKDEPYCFWCCSEIPAEYCEMCGCTKIVDVPCCDEDESGPNLWVVK